MVPLRPVSFYGVTSTTRKFRPVPATANSWVMIPESATKGGPVAAPIKLGPRQNRQLRRRTRAQPSNTAPAAAAIGAGSGTAAAPNAASPFTVSDTVGSMPKGTSSE